jgi:hypothetical protein
LATQISADELQVLVQLKRRKMTSEELSRALRWIRPKVNHVAYGLSHARPKLIQQDEVSMKWGITRPGRAQIPRRTLGAAGGVFAFYKFVLAHFPPMK